MKSHRKHILLLLLLAFSLAALPSCVRNSWKAGSVDQIQLRHTQEQAGEGTESHPIYIRFQTDTAQIVGRLVSLDEDAATLTLCQGYPKQLGLPMEYLSPRNEHQTSFRRGRISNKRVRWGQCVEEGNPVSVPFSTVEKAWISEVNIPVSILMTLGGAGLAYVGAIAALIVALFIVAVLFSCPMVYVQTPDGNIALIGEAFTGAVGQQLERTDLLRLPAEGENLTVLVANESKEIEFIDLAQLVLVDSRANSRAVPTHEAELVLVGTSSTPRSVQDMFGEQTEVLLDSDGRVWSSDLVAAAATDEPRAREWLVVDFEGQRGDSVLLLELRNTQWSNIVAGEIYKAQGSQLDNLMKRAGKNKGDKLRAFREEAGFDLRVEAEQDGVWTEIAVVPSVGPAGFREVAVPLSNAHGASRYRISGGIGFWEVDSIAMAPQLASPQQKRIAAESATLGERDVSPLLSAIDGERVVQNEGQTTVLNFSLPPQPADTNRTVFLETRGYYEVLELEESRMKPMLLARIQRDPLAVGELSLELYQEFIDGLPFVLASYVK